MILPFRRSLILLLLVVIGSLPHRAGGTETPLLETPWFRNHVVAGELPPVGQRVPETPSIAALNGEGRSFGRHGGVLRLLMAKPRDTKLMTVYGYARLVGYERNLKLVPDILERLDVREGREFTLVLRKGHRWSDGHPFTTEDFRYYWEDVAMNKKLSPLGPNKWLLTDKKPPRFEIIDERTVRYTWPHPNAYFLPAIANARPLFIYRPAHFLKQFHARYADAAVLQRRAREGHYMDWAALHHAKDRMYALDNPDMPTLQPWRNTTRPPSERFVFERNPFYYRIDSVGRQLPYIDRVIMSISMSNLIPAKTGAGESDLQARYIAFEDYTFLKDNEKRYDFSVRLWRTVKGAHIALYPNLNTVDPVWRSVIRDVRFRRALSLAINRQEINEIIYFGLASPGNNTILESSPLFRPEYRTTWSGFNPAKANRLLDEMSLIRKTGDDIRRLPDGRPLTLIVDTSGEGTETTDVLELIGDMWSEIGIKVLVRPTQRDILRHRVFSGQSVMAVWSGLANGVPTPDIAPDEFVPSRQFQLQWPNWGKFIESGGQAGEPPDLPAAKELLGLMSKWHRAPDLPAKEEIWHRILEIHTAQVFSIGIVNRTLQPVVVNNRLRNVPTEGIYNWNPGAYFGIYRPDTFWFMKKSAEHRATDGDPAGGRPAGTKQ